jgi:hypothetical protein
VHKTILLIAILTVGLVDWSYAFADDRYDEHPPEERFQIRIGGFIIDRFDSTQFPVGTLIDLEENFEVDSRESVLRIDGFYRFSKQHRIDWTYYRSRRDGESVATEEYVIGDPDDPEGGFIIPKDARISTDWNFDLLKLGYVWSFLNKRRYEAFVGAGLNIRKVDVKIEYQATLATFGESDRLDAAETLPLLVAECIQV